MKSLCFKVALIGLFLSSPLTGFSQYDNNETSYGGDCNGAINDTAVDFYRLIVDSINQYHNTVGSFFYHLKIDSAANPSPTDTTWAYNAGNACICSNLGLNPDYDFRKILNYLLWLNKGRRIRFPNCDLTVGRGKFVYYNTAAPTTVYRKMQNDTFYNPGQKTCDGGTLPATLIQATESQPLGLYMYSNTSIYFPPKCVLHSKKTQTQNANTIYFMHSCNVSLCGLKLDGPNISFDVDSSLANYGGRIQDGPGAVSMIYSKNISMYNSKIRYASGDGISLSRFYSYPNNENIILENIHISRSGRSGISIISVKDLYINNITIDSTGVSKSKSCINSGLRTLVWSGINIEPNNDTFGITPKTKRCQIDGNIWVSNYLSLNNRGTSVSFLGLANLNDDAKYTDPANPPLSLKFCGLQDIRTPYYLTEKNTCTSGSSSYFWGYGASIGLWVLPGGSSISDIKINGTIDFVNPILDRGGVDNYYVPYTSSPMITSALKVNVYAPTFIDPIYSMVSGVNLNGYLSKYDTSSLVCGSAIGERPSNIESNSDNPLFLYPNPTDNYLFIKISNGNFQSADMHSMDGKKILSFNNIKGNSLKVDISFLKKGTYIINALISGKTHSKKFVVL